MNLLGYALTSLAFVGAFLWVFSSLENWENERKQNSRNVANEFYDICLDNVSYWYLREGYSGQLAVRIDPETMQPKGCD